MQPPWSSLWPSTCILVNGGDCLCVDNNILPSPPSSILRSGLKNIQRRYAFLPPSPFTIHGDGVKFTVCLPLLVSKKLPKWSPSGHHRRWTTCCQSTQTFIGRLRNQNRVVAHCDSAAGQSLPASLPAIDLLLLRHPPGRWPQHRSSARIPNHHPRHLHHRLRRVCLKHLNSIALIIW